MKNIRPSMFRRPPTWGLSRRSLKRIGKLSDPTYNAPRAKINFVCSLEIMGSATPAGRWFRTQMTLASAGGGPWRQMIALALGRWGFRK